MTHKRLRATFREILEELDKNPAFAERVARALDEEKPSAPSRSKKRRSPAILDPIKAYEDKGETGLRMALGALSLDQLRDIVAEYGMDPAKLAMKWTVPSRVIDQIVGTAVTRARKGDAFR